MDTRHFGTLVLAAVLSSCSDRTIISEDERTDGGDSESGSFGMETETDGQVLTCDDFQYCMTAMLEIANDPDGASGDFFASPNTPATVTLEIGYNSDECGSLFEGKVVKASASTPDVEAAVKTLEGGDSWSSVTTNTGEPLWSGNSSFTTVECPDVPHSLNVNFQYLVQSEVDNDGCTMMPIFGVVDPKHIDSAAGILRRNECDAAESASAAILAGGSFSIE